MMNIRILLADDHKIVREGTRQLLEQWPEFEIAGEAADGSEAVRLVQQLHPDVVVLDVRLPGLNGLEATRAIRSGSPHVRILILSAYDDDRYVFPLLEAGASGYLLKTSSGVELADAIRIVQRGETALSPQIAGKVVGRLAGKAASPNQGGMEKLTERELEVLQAAALGRSNKAIAAGLTISPQTVQVHLRNIFSKLDVNSRAEAVAYAIGHGWISLETDDEF